MFHVCSNADFLMKSELFSSIETVPPADSGYRQSIRGRTARVPNARWEEFVDRLTRGPSVAGMAEREGLTAEPGRVFFTLDCS